ncbi:MAG TPA: TetR/AcrR family transcriptional regulator [Candidatus Desulfobacillus sp.]|nr:TetR/AcrR family transcriptional regulator [Candidatus Desulfobacillus sp.]
MSAAAEVLAQVSDPKRVVERRGQILRAAVKLFSRNGYYTTTIQQIAREAGVSTGLIYQYFGDKDDILFLSLKLVLDTYEHDIPPQLEGLAQPVERLCMALWAYCRIVDRLLDATVLAYRSTKSLRADRRALIKAAETRTNRLFEECIDACVAAGHMREVNVDLLAYQLVLFAHSWALKHWSLGERYGLAGYVDEGVELLVAPFLTTKGRRVLAAMRARTGRFGSRRASSLRPAGAKAGKAATAGRRAA